MPLFAPFLAASASDDELAESLAKQFTAEDEAGLLAAFSDGNADQRWWIVRALALVGGAASVSLLLQTLNDAAPLLRSAALLALAALQNRQSALIQPQLALMAQRLADEDGTVRQAASDALAQSGNDAVPVLAEVLKGSHQGARTRATMALRHIATQQAATGQTNKMPAAAVLYRCLNDPNYMVHTYAYEALDELGLLETLLLAV